MHKNSCRQCPRVIDAEQPLPGVFQRRPPLDTPLAPKTQGIPCILPPLVCHRPGPPGHSAAVTMLRTEVTLSLSHPVPLDSELILLFSVSNFGGKSNG